MRPRHTAALCLCLALLPMPARAAPSALLGAQGRLAATGGGPVADGKYGLLVSLYPTAKGGEALWSEAMLGVVVNQGLFAVQLGVSAKNPLDPAVFAKNAEVWLSVGVDGEPDLPPTRLMAVPYAFVAHTALLADGLSKPLGSEALASGSITSDKVGFAYAGASSKGGPATAALDLQCTACVEAGELVAAAVGTTQLADGAVTAPKLAANAVTTAKLEDNAVTTAKLAQGAVTASKLGVAWAAADEPDGVAKLAASANGLKCTGCVTSTHLADAAVVTPKLADLGVTTPKLADGAVTAAKLADGAVTAAKIGSFAFPVADKAPFTCDAAHYGHAWIDKKSNVLNICNGESDHPIALAPVGTANAPALSCLDVLKKLPAAATGVYWLDPDGAGGTAAFQVYCDMTTDGGGWTLVGKTAGLAHDADGGVLDGKDTARWKEKQYLGDVTNLTVQSALGSAYHTVAFTDFMLMGLNDPTKKLAWRMNESFANLHAVFNSGVRKTTTTLLVGNFKSLDWRPSCGTGNGPDATGPHFYGFNINADQHSPAYGNLFNGYSGGWCAALAGYGRDNSAGDYTGGGLGAVCASGAHQMGRHYWGYGDACNASQWSTGSLNSFFGHAFFVR